MTIVAFTKSRCPELADYLEDCCEKPLSFEGDCPNAHSCHNHIHLWALEWWADHHAWIDLDYRVRFVDAIFSVWRGRMKGLAPYRENGYRLYLYEDLAPTISVVGETTEGFPYPAEPAFVESTKDIMALYVGRKWMDNFAIDPRQVTQERILDTIEKNAGSISRPSADALGLQVGMLRRAIEFMNITDDVNAIRKRYKRRPAKFRDESDLPFRMRVYEERLPPRYR